MVNKLFGFFPFGRKKSAGRKAGAQGAAPPDAGADLAAGRRPRMEDLGEILTGARPEPPAPAAASEPPTVILPPEADPQIKAGFRSVKNSVDMLKQRAMTAQQLRETIESTIESRVGDLRETMGRIQALFHAHASGARTPPGESSERMAERMAALEARMDEIARDVPPMLAKLAGDVPAATAKLAEDLELRDARLLAWLERISVQGHASSKEAEKAAEERAAQRALLENLQREKLRVEALRKKLYAVRDRLVDGMAELREGVSRNVFSRALLARRIESALQPFESAIDSLEAIIKELE